MSTTGSLSQVKQALLAKAENFQEQLIELLLSLPEELEQLEQAEEQLRSGLLKLGRGLLQNWSEAVPARVAQPECGECEEPMRHKGHVAGTVVTTLGDIRVRRPRFRCERCGREHYPHDSRLRFLGHGVSWALAKVVSRLGAQLPFEQARRSLLTDYGVRLSKQRIEQVCEEAGQRVLAQEDAGRRRLSSLPVAEQPLALPDSEFSPEKAYVYGDGAMVHAAGEWQEIRVASVAAVGAEDEVLRVQHRARFLSCEEFGWQLLILAREAGYHRAKLRVFLADGARWLWDLAATNFPDAIQILDWYHLSEHVHDTAAVLFGEGNTEAEAWSEARKTELWEGRWRQTLERLVQERKTSRSPAKREKLRQLAQYLQNNGERIDYPRYRALGLRIGSGQVEGACKSLVAARCKQAGMRNWTRQGIEGVLRLRAALQVDDYDSLWTHHLKSAA
jgi:hypothetical protein